jgi:hypothetical protein
MGRTVTGVLALLVAAGVVVAGGVGGGTGGGAQPAVASGEAAAASDSTAGGATEAGGATTGAAPTEEDANADGGGLLDAFGDAVSFDSDGDGVDFGVATDWGGVSFEDIGDGSGEGRVTHDAIDDGTADAGRTGACAVGLGGDGSPLDLGFDGESSTFEMGFSANGSADRGSDGGGVEGDASEVVSECASTDR